MLKNIGLLALAIIGLALLFIPVVLRQIFYYAIRKELDELSRFFFSLAYTMDHLGGTLLYRTNAKTISAVTGLKAYTEKKEGVEFSYIYPFERFINAIFSDDFHCINAAKHEFPDKF
jgi:hypothetical protein